MGTKTVGTTAEAEIRELIEAWTNAIRAKDAGAAVACLAPDVRLFDLAPPLQYAGADAYRKGLQEWFATFTGLVGYEVHHLRIEAGDGVAFSHSLNHIRGQRTNGEETDVWVRETVGYRKVTGAWKVAHEHASVPFYMDGSLRAAVDLKP